MAVQNVCQRWSFLMFLVYTVQYTVWSVPEIVHVYVLDVEEVECGEVVAGQGEEVYHGLVDGTGLVVQPQQVQVR